MTDNTVFSEKGSAVSVLRKTSTGALVALFAVVVSGCASEGVSGQRSGLSDTSLAASIEQERENAKGKPYEEFVLAVLEDGEISESEVLESQARVNECMRAAGVDGFEYLGLTGGSKNDNTAEDPNGEKADAALDSCERKLGHIPISGLYYIARTSPHGEDPDVLVAACLVRRQVVDPSYSAEDFKREFIGYMEQHVDGGVEGDPMLALSYTVPVEEGARVLGECIDHPLEGERRDAHGRCTCWRP